MQISRLAAALLSLAASAAMAANPQPPRAVPLSFSSAGVELRGELLLPPGAGPYPGIAYLHGSGCGSRDDMRAIATHFAGRGIAGLLFDKRGCGTSGGQWQKASLDELAADAEAALRHLAARPEIDSGRLGLWGISQSGWSAPIAANRSGLARFLVVVTGGGATPEQVERYGYESRLAHAGFRLADTPRASALLDDYFRYLAAGANRERFLESLAAAAGEPWYAALGLRRVVPAAEDQAAWSWVADYEPAGDISKLSVPALVLLGALDRQSPLVETSRGWAAALAHGGIAESQLVIFPGAGHGLTVGASHGPPGTSQQYVAGYLPAVESWLERILRSD